MDLINQIESLEIEAGKIHIFSLGQSGYVVKIKNTIIYIDPYLSDFVENPKGLNEPLMKRNFPPPVFPEQINKIDAVLCTHAHGDHMDPWTLEKINHPFTFFTSENAYRNNGVELPSQNLLFIKLGKKYRIGEFEIEAFPAAHYEIAGKDGKPDCLSFLVTAFGKSLYFWGDGLLYGGLIERLKQFQFDLFFAPINGRDWFREQRSIIGNLSARELAELCGSIKVKVVVPNHYDLFKNNSESPERFYDYLHKFAPEQKYLKLPNGESIRI